MNEGYATIREATDVLLRSENLVIITHNGSRAVFVPVDALVALIRHPVDDLGNVNPFALKFAQEILDGVDE